MNRKYINLGLFCIFAVIIISLSVYYNSDGFIDTGSSTLNGILNIPEWLVTTLIILAVVLGGSLMLYLAYLSTVTQAKAIGSIGAGAGNALSGLGNWFRGGPKKSANNKPANST